MDNETRRSGLQVPVLWLPSQIFQIEQQIHLVLRPVGTELTLDISIIHAWAKGMGSNERKIFPVAEPMGAACSHPSS